MAKAVKDNPLVCPQIVEETFEIIADEWKAVKAFCRKSLDDVSVLRLTKPLHIFSFGFNPLPDFYLNLKSCLA